MPCSGHMSNSPFVGGVKVVNCIFAKDEETDILKVYVNPAPSESGDNTRCSKFRGVK